MEKGFCKKHFNICSNPRIIKNRYTGDEILAPCGKCPTCLNLKSSMSTFLCTMEQADNKYTMFVTLTYNDKCMPKMKPVLSSSSSVSNVYKFYGVTPNIYGYNELLATYVDDKKDPIVPVILKKANLNCLLGYANKQDIQNFLKRFRDYCYRYAGETIRYYAVSEYGPEHFRPHWHLLIYFSSDKLLQKFKYCLYKSWRFGFISYSLAGNSANNYVAGYVNSTVSLPSFYTNSKAIRPRSYHSRFFGKAYYYRFKKEVYHPPYTKIDELSRVLCGKEVEVFPIRSVQDTFFPKCYRFSVLPYNDLVRCYRIYYEAVILFGIEKCTELAQYITDVYLNSHEYIDNSRKYEFFNFFSSLFANRLYLLYSNKKDDRKKFVTSVYNCLRISEHFIRFVCGCNTDYNVNDRYVNIILDYYSHRELSRLNLFYSAQEEFLETFTVNDKCYASFYNNPIMLNRDWNFDVSEYLSLNPYYTRNLVDNAVLCHDRVKHKRLNDANSLLLNS